MDCEQALALISARIDREITPSESAWLREHLDSCPSCRATSEAFTLQHEELRESFEPRRRAVAATVGRVNVAVKRNRRASTPLWRRFVRPLVLIPAAAVLWIIAGIVLFNALGIGGGGGGGPATAIPSSPPPPIQPAAVAQGERLTPRSLGRAIEPPLVHQGRLATAAGERRRARLLNGALVFLNENTTINIDHANGVTLERGCAYFEQVKHIVGAPANPNGLVVMAGDRFVTGEGTKFAVQLYGNGLRIVDIDGEVTTGEQHFSQPPFVLHSGQLLTPQNKTAPAPRVSHLLDWTRDLRAAGETPLVPASSYDGGALIAVDASGQEAKLSLRKYHVDVHIEDGFARTTIDQTYFNHHPWRLEGTFHFPLPPDASLSRLAMYVDGRLNEGGMVERDYGRTVYDRIVAGQRDPALLEWVDGSTFKMRVFPLEGRQEKRIVLSYTQRVPTLYGRSQYRFPAGHSLQMVRDWSFHALVRNGSNYSAQSPSHPGMMRTVNGNDLVLSDAASDCKVDRDIVLDLTDPAFVGDTGDAVRFASAELDGNEYLMLRYRPHLPAQGKREPRNWIILFEASADRDPLLARAQIEIVRGLLRNAGKDDTFTVLAASNRVEPEMIHAAPPPFPHAPGAGPAGIPAPIHAHTLVTPDSLENAVRMLEQTHLVGALDLGRALRQIQDTNEPRPLGSGVSGAPLPNGRGSFNSYLVHVGGGYTGMGTPQDELPKLLPANVKYIGIGVGKRWNRAFMKQCAEKTGGYYTQINPDESISWRTFDLMATLNTPRLLNIQVRRAGSVSDRRKALAAPVANAPGSPDDDTLFLLDNNAIAQGEEICAVARLSERGAIPQELTITGRLDGVPFERKVRVENVAAKAGYLPRTWAKLEIDRLLADGPRHNKNTIIDLSKQMYVMTPFTSLLVLENEAMYKEYKVDRGRKDHWAMYPCPDKIPVVYEPDPTMPTDVRNAPKGLKPTANEVMKTVCMRHSPRWLGNEALELDAANGITINGTVVMPRARTTNRIERWANMPAGIEAHFAHSRVEFGFDHPDGDIKQLMLGDSRVAKHRVSIQGISVDNATLPFAVERLTPELVYEPEEPSADPQAQYLPAYLPAISGFHQAWAWAERTSQITSGTLNMNMFPVLDPGTPEGLGEIRRLMSYAEDRRSEDRFLDIPYFGGPTPEERLRRNLMERKLKEIYGNSDEPLVYTRLRYTRDPRMFTNLLTYAPGLNTSEADILAVLEAEAMPDLRQAPGRIDPAARKLIEASRKPVWRKLTLPGDKNQPEQVLRFDGVGRYAYERKPALGLQEIVVCDGDTLLHLYPEIGVGGRRSVSRFHRAELGELLPWLLPPAEDLARGVDLECVNDHTVALVPHRSRETPRYVQLHLVFDKDRLAERRLVEMPENKIKSREIYDGQGGVRWLDAAGKEVGKVSRAIGDCDAPDLHPDLTKLVVLPLPYRSRVHVMNELGLDHSLALSADYNGCVEYSTPEQQLKLLAALVAEQHAGDAQTLYRRCFRDVSGTQRGLFTLLSAAGVDVSGEPGFRRCLEESPDDELLQYLALCGNSLYKFVQRRVPLVQPRGAGQGSGFLRDLLDAQSLLHRFDAPDGRSIRWETHQGDVRRSQEFLQRHPRDVLGLAVLHEMQDRTRTRSTEAEEERYRILAREWNRRAAASDGAYRARYEQASCLANAGQRPEAEKVFKDLFAQALKAETLPPIDERFKNGLQNLDEKHFVDNWNPLMRDTARQFIEKKQYAAVVALAWQCHSINDWALAHTLLEELLLAIQDQPDRWITQWSVIDFYWHTSDFARADELLQPLLKDDKVIQSSGPWRLAAQVAEKRGMETKAISYLEKALDLEYQRLPEVIDLRSWRADYGKLLEHYRVLAQGAKSLQTPPPADLAARTQKIVDRWRAHDPEASDPCKTAADLFLMLGETDLAWDYQTTALIGRGLQVSAWRELAERMVQQGQHNQADQALLVAADVDPSNAEIVWLRVKNLQAANRKVEAEPLLKRLAGDKWPERYQSIRAAAQYELKGR